jgi:hypothetical protein
MWTAVEWQVINAGHRSTRHDVATGQDSGTCQTQPAVYITVIACCHLPTCAGGGLGRAGACEVLTLQGVYEPIHAVHAEWQVVHLQLLRGVHTHTGCILLPSGTQRAQVSASLTEQVAVGTSAHRGSMQPLYREAGGLQVAGQVRSGGEAMCQGLGTSIQW